jgi:uncharacterized repeat protein (TIGR03803 family)
MRSKKLSSGLTVVLALLALTLAAVGTPAAAQADLVLHSFNNNGKDGTNPRGGLVADAAGNLYGTTYTGGIYNYGTVFELLPKIGGGWTEKVLHSFKEDGSDGGYPEGTMIFDSAGNLYGITDSGGSDYEGTAFELSPAAGGKWTEKILWNFGVSGGFPAAGMIFDASGNLYGTTASGGSYGGGTAFELSPGTGGTWTATTLHGFTFNTTTDGYFPLSGLLFDSAGNLFGTTYVGGTYGTGTAFELTRGAGGTWTETVVYNFNNGNTGSTDPNSIDAGLIADAAGNLYGTGFNGGDYNSGGVFELTQGTGGAWTATLLHSFGSKSGDGYNPMAGLIFDASGNLYGTTYDGGIYGYGAAFELEHNSNGSWTEKTLHSFNDNGKDGYNPYAGLILGPGGDLYGTTGSGGAYSEGTVFVVKP